MSFASAGLEHEQRYLADLDPRRSAASSRSTAGRDSSDRRRGTAPAAADDRCDAMRRARRRHLPGHLLRRPLARTRRLPAAAWRRRSGRAPRCLGATRSPTPSSRGTSRRAPCSRSALCRPADAHAGASSPSGCTSPSGAARTTTESHCASTTTWPTTARAQQRFEESCRRRPARAYPPDGTYPDPSSTATSAAGRRVPGTAPRRRPSRLVAGIAPRQRAGSDERGIATLARSADAAASARPAARRHAPETSSESASRRVSRSRGEDAGTLIRAPAAQGRSARNRSAGCRAPAAVARRSLLRHRGRPVRVRRRARIPLRRPGAARPSGEHAFRLWRDADGAVTLAAREGGVRAAHGPLHGPARAGSRRSTSTTTRPTSRPRSSRLMGRHATREDEVDRLLRGGVLVDLYRVVRQGLRASVESYSIKRLEPLYGYKREVDLRDAGSSIVAFEAWLQLRRGRAGRRRRPRRGSSATTTTTSFNTLELRDWLEARRAGARRDDGRRRPPAGAPRAGRRRGGAGRDAGRVQSCEARLTAGVPADASGAHARAAGPLAARPAPELAPPRGEGDLVAVLPPAGAD